MSLISSSPVTFLLSIIAITHATTITVVNNCDYTVWAAADPGGGRQLNKGNTWNLNPAPGTRMARIWGRTGCIFDGNGNGNCQTGGCGKLVCNPGNWGTIPKTLFEYTLAQPNNPTDTIDISLIEGFISLSPSVPLPTPVHLVGSVVQLGAPLTLTGSASRTGGFPAGVKVLARRKVLELVVLMVTLGFTSKVFRRMIKARSTFSCPSETNYRLTFCP